MSNKMVLAAGMALSLSTGHVLAQDKMQSSVSCDELNWSAEVLAENPDIGKSCQAVYEKAGKLYAQVPVEVVRVRGNRMTFRPLHTDGSRGTSRSIQLDSSFRANIGGRSYRAGDLMRGQQLNVYIPEDRFALAVEDDDGPDSMDLISIEEAVAMPTTASPLFLLGVAGGAFVALGGLLGGLRRRLG